MDASFEQLVIENILLVKLILAFFIGALLGLEREHSKQQEVVGLRTFALISLLGCLLTIIGSDFLGTGYLAIAGFVVVGLLAVALYIMNLFKFKEIGMTTTIAILLAYVLGVMVCMGQEMSEFKDPVFIAIMVALILFTKDRLHRLVRNISHKEMLDLMEFLIIVGIIYPFIPQSPIDLSIISLDLNSLWLLVMLISIMNLIGFIGSRLITGKNSMGFIGLLGGLISQKVSCASLGEVYKKTQNADLVAGSLLMANASLLVRNLILIGLFVPIEVLGKLVVPVLVGFTLLAGFGYYKIRNSKKTLLKIESPFNVENAVQLSLKLFLIIVVMELLMKYMQHMFFVTIFVGGIVSGAATLASLAIIAKGPIGIDPVTIILGFGIITISELLLGIIPILWLKKSMPVVPKYMPYAIVATLVFACIIALACCT